MAERGDEGTSTDVAASITPIGESADGPNGRRPKQVLAIIAIVLIGLNLRPIANGLGAAIPAIRDDLGLSGSAAGVLNAMPGLCFVVFGLVAPALSSRFGMLRTLLLGLIASAAGQVIRAVIPGVGALFGGSILALAGTALANILLPGVVRALFPRHVPAVTSLYTTCMMLGATAGSGLTIPIAHAFDDEWRTGVGSWAILAVIALVPWVAMLGNAGDGLRQRPKTGIQLRSLLRNRVAWSIAIFFGMQAMQAYVITGWLSQILVDAGVSLTLAGSAVAVFAAAGIPMAMLIPMVARRQGRLPAIVVGLGLAYVAGYLGLLISPDDGYWLWAALVGIGGGTFPLAMLIVAIRAHTYDGLTALSAFAQSTAYAFATVGPFVVGFLHDLTGGWTAPLIMMIVVAGLMMAFGLLAIRPRYVDDPQV